MLGPRVLEARVLDLYAGAGGLGIEALSRGAAIAVFVERSAPAVRAIKTNLHALGYESRATIVQSEARRWLAAGPPDLAQATLALLDPPYADPDLDAVLAALAARLPAGATVVVEHATRRSLTTPPRLAVDRTRRHGDTSVTIARIEA